MSAMAFLKQATEWRHELSPCFLIFNTLLTKNSESSIRIPFTLYGCPSLVNQGFCKALANQGFCKVAQIGEVEGARRRIAGAHLETRNTDWSRRANLTK